MIGDIIAVQSLIRTAGRDLLRQSSILLQPQSIPHVTNKVIIICSLF